MFSKKQNKIEICAIAIFLGIAGTVAGASERMTTDCGWRLYYRISEDITSGKTYLSLPVEASSICEDRDENMGQTEMKINNSLNNSDISHTDVFLTSPEVWTIEIFMRKVGGTTMFDNEEFRKTKSNVRIISKARHVMCHLILAGLITQTVGQEMDQRIAFIAGYMAENNL